MLTDWPVIVSSHSIWTGCGVLSPYSTGWSITVRRVCTPSYTNQLQPLQWLNPLLTGQLTWQFPVFDGPSKLSWDLSVAVVDGLADQGIIPILYILAESYRWVPFSMLNWLAKNCKRGTYSIWYRQADLEESPLSTDQPGWYLTHLVWAGQTSKILTINIPASLISNLSYTG